MKVLQKLIIELVKFVSLHIFEKPILLSFSLKVNSWDEFVDTYWGKLLECFRLLGVFNYQIKLTEKVFILSNKFEEVMRSLVSWFQQTNTIICIHKQFSLWIMYDTFKDDHSRLTVSALWMDRGNFEWKFIEYVESFKA